MGVKDGVNEVVHTHLLDAVSLNLGVVTPVELSKKLVPVPRHGLGVRAVSPHIATSAITHSLQVRFDALTRAFPLEVFASIVETPSDPSIDPPLLTSCSNLFLAASEVTNEDASRTSLTGIRTVVTRVTERKNLEFWKMYQYVSCSAVMRTTLLFASMRFGL